MIGWLYARLMAAGAGSAATRAGAWLLVGAVIIAGLGVAKCRYDHGLLERHATRQELDAARSQRRADEAAARQRWDDAARVQEEEQQYDEAIETAREEGRDERAAYYECVRLQQRARADGRPPAAC